MKKLLSTLALTPLLVTTVHANELNNDIDMNMLWADNEEFQSMNLTDEQLMDQRDGNVLWADNEEYQRVNLTREYQSDYINANMLWSNNKEFHAN